MEKTICKIMLKDHDRINKLIDFFEKELNKSIGNSRRIFNQLKWNLDKHFFVEEKIIFSIYETESEEDNLDILKLLKEHKDIYWLLNKIEDSLDSGLKPELTEFKKALKIHANFEDNNFYPKLDRDLDDKQKSLIFNRADEIVAE